MDGRKEGRLLSAIIRASNPPTYLLARARSVKWTVGTAGGQDIFRRGLIGARGNGGGRGKGRGRMVGGRGAAIQFIDRCLSVPSLPSLSFPLFK